MGNTCSCNCKPDDYEAKNGDPSELLLKEGTEAVDEEENFDLEPATHFPSREYATPMKENPLELNDNILEALNRLSEMQPPRHVDSVDMRKSVHLPEFFLLDDGTIYNGHWFLGKPHAFGRFYYNNGNYYEGTVNQGVPHGDMGRKIWIDGSYYEGEFQKGEMQGEGTLDIIGKARFKGNFVNGKLNGEGTENWHNKCLYKGHFVEGKRDGFGKLEWIKKEGEEFYEGEFLDGKHDGKGKYKWQDGRTYEGDWREGKMHGEGKFTWTDGRMYIGTYRNDNKNGVGTFHWPGGRSFKGMWINGLQEGEGIFIDRFNVEHLVKYVNGVRVGHEDGSIQNMSDLPGVD